MGSTNKIVAGWIAFAFVVLHVSFIFIYAAPQQMVGSRAKSIVTPYVSPLFEQTWSMFAPCPVVEGRIKMKVSWQNDSTDWFYPTEESLKWHSCLRMSHHGEIALYEANLVHWVNKNMYELSLGWNEPVPDYFYELIPETESYWMLSRYAYRIGKQTSHSENFTVLVSVELSNVQTGDSTEITYPEYKWK